jgi:hypothetical protein
MRVSGQTDVSRRGGDTMGGDPTLIKGRTTEKGWNRLSVVDPGALISAAGKVHARFRTPPPPPLIKGRKARGVGIACASLIWALRSRPLGRCTPDSGPPPPPLIKGRKARGSGIGC